LFWLHVAVLLLSYASSLAEDIRGTVPLLVVHHAMHATGGVVAQKVGHVPDVCAVAVLSTLLVLYHTQLSQDPNVQSVDCCHRTFWHWGFGVMWRLLCSVLLDGLFGETIHGHHRVLTAVLIVQVRDGEYGGVLQLQQTTC
jgi:hypothetical protein